MKTMIRERNSRAYRAGSVGYHAAALAAATTPSPARGYLPAVAGGV
ncbi:hypothetical protein AB0N09_09445 [Streptomyces erythrochromogenes]